MSSIVTVTYVLYRKSRERETRNKDRDRDRERERERESNKMGWLEKNELGESVCKNQNNNI